MKYHDWQEDGAFLRCPCGAWAPQRLELVHVLNPHTGQPSKGKWSKGYDPGAADPTNPYSGTIPAGATLCEAA